MNKFLRTRSEIDKCTSSLNKQGLIEHPQECKNWDIFNILPHVGNGNFLDMGCSGSGILKNLVKLGKIGLKYGIDYIKINTTSPEIEYFQGDLMHTPFQDKTFEYISCLSVIEHAVDFDIFAKECSRLMVTNAKLFVTYDYWNPKIDASDTKICNLPWTILDKNDVLHLVEVCKKQKLILSSPIDWTIQDQVINPMYNAPGGKSYTFGFLMFEKGEI